MHPMTCTRTYRYHGGKRKSNGAFFCSTTVVLLPGTPIGLQREPEEAGSGGNREIFTQSLSTPGNHLSCLQTLELWRQTDIRDLTLDLLLKLIFFKEKNPHVSSRWSGDENEALYKGTTDTVLLCCVKNKRRKMTEGYFTGVLLMNSNINLNIMYMYTHRHRHTQYIKVGIHFPCVRAWGAISASAYRQLDPALHIHPFSKRNLRHVTSGAEG